MREDGKLDYLELPSTDLAATKDFYTQAFGWGFVDYGPTYAAFDQGLDGGFDADNAERTRRPCPSSTPTTWKPCSRRSRRRAA